MAKILIIDDEAWVRDLYAMEMEEEGHRVAVADGRGSAMERLTEFEPDVVIIDLFLKQVMGWDLLKEIKAVKPYLPVFILTAYDTYKRDPRLASAEGYLIKNIAVLQEIKDQVARYIRP